MILFKTLFSFKKDVASQWFKE